ncbi:hypothetical protein MTO96_030137 [Rhipicephalus appendiculatus]
MEGGPYLALGEITVHLLASSSLAFRKEFTSVINCSILASLLSVTAGVAAPPAILTVPFTLSAQEVPAVGLAQGTPSSKRTGAALDLERLFSLGSELRLDLERLRERERLLGPCCRLGAGVGVSAGALVADFDRSRSLRRVRTT